MRTLSGVAEEDDAGEGALAAAAATPASGPSVRASTAALAGSSGGAIARTAAEGGGVTRVGDEAVVVGPPTPVVSAVTLAPRPKKAKTPMLHWGQGTMAKALAHLLGKIRKQGPATDKTDRAMPA